jgi:hypothetical protein
LRSALPSKSSGIFAYLAVVILMALHAAMSLDLLGANEDHMKWEMDRSIVEQISALLVPRDRIYLHFQEMRLAVTNITLIQF